MTALQREETPVPNFITSCFYTNCVQYFYLPVMVYFEQPVTIVNTCELPTLSILILSIHIWSMLTKRELAKWELMKWEVDKVGRFTI